MATSNPTPIYTNLTDATIAGDLLDRFALNQMLPPDPANRLHNQHPPPPARHTKRTACPSPKIGGQSSTPITPPLGSIFHAETHIDEVGWKQQPNWLTPFAWRCNRRARPMQPEPAPRTAPQVPVVDDWAALQTAFEVLPSLSLRQDKAADGYEAITVTQHGDEPVAKLVRTAMGWRVQALFRGGVELKDSGGQVFSTAAQVASAFRLVEKRLVGDQERIRQGYLKAPRRPILLRETPRPQ